MLQICSTESLAYLYNLYMIVFVDLLFLSVYIADLVCLLLLFIHLYLNVEKIESWLPMIDSDFP